MPNYRLGKYRGKWAVIWIENSQTRRASLYASVGEISRENADILFKQWVANESASQVTETVTVGVCLEAYFKAKGDRVAYLSHLVKYFRSHLPEHVNQALVDKYVATRVGRSPSTLNSEINCMKTALRWAKNQKILKGDVPYFQAPPPSPPREVWKTKEQIALLLKEMKAPHLRLATLLMRYTGARVGAVCSLPWDRVTDSHIDYNDPTIPRTRKRRAFVPIHPELLPALQEARQGALTPFVIEYGGHKVEGIKKGFRRAARMAGMPEVTPHVVRHSVATWMAMAGRSYKEIADFLAISEKMVEKVYAKHTPGYLAEAVKSISGGEAASLSLQENQNSPRRGRLVQLHQNTEGKTGTTQENRTVDFGRIRDKSGRWRRSV